jgi:hypothetical protein
MLRRRKPAAGWRGILWFKLAILDADQRSTGDLLKLEFGKREMGDEDKGTV